MESQKARLRFFFWLVSRLHWIHMLHPVRLAYQPPASSTFLSDKPATSNQPAILFSQNRPAPAISHQPTEQAAYLVNQENN
jgi:hypothetical protein